MKVNDIKSDVKRLIQEHVKTNAVTREIDSPYAKYNSRGQLMCVVCGVPVKSKIIWQAHINKRSHKENLARLIEKQEKISKLQYQKSEVKDIIKRLSPDGKQPNQASKKVKLEKSKGILKNISSYASSEEESDSEVDSRIKPKLEDVNSKKKPSVKSELPDDFFDANIQKANSYPSLKSLSSPNRCQNDTDKSKPCTSDALPEGFFDDPVADAKARNVEYRDKDAEEWEFFLKEVSAAEAESRQIIAEDKEEAAIETQLEQADEQIKCLERIVELDKAKRSQLSERRTNMEEVHSDDSSDEEFSTVIWRTKNSLI